MDINYEFLYWEFDPDKRRIYLSEFLEQGSQENDISVWLQLLDFRYENKKNRRADRFMSFLLLLIFHAGHSDTGGKLKKARREILEKLNNEDLKKIISQSDNGQNILRHELINSLLLYFTTCINDRSFGSLAFGFRKDESYVMEKIKKQAHEISHSLPGKMGIAEEYDFLSKIIDDSYNIFINEGKRFSFLS